MEEYYTLEIFTNDLNRHLEFFNDKFIMREKRDGIRYRKGNAVDLLSFNKKIELPDDVESYAIVLCKNIKYDNNFYNVVDRKEIVCVGSNLFMYENDNCDHVFVFESQISTSLNIVSSSIKSLVNKKIVEMSKIPNVSIDRNILYDAMDDLTVPSNKIKKNILYLK